MQVVQEARRFNVVACGRRWGKTFLGIDRLIRPMLEGQPVGWFAPTYRMLAEVWRTVVPIVRPIAQTISQQQHYISAATGGKIEMWSLENPETIRGREYKRIILDEAAMVRDLERIWFTIIFPTLTSLRGDAWVLSTPRGSGSNFFHNLFLRGQSTEQPLFQSWQMPTITNPYVAPEEIQIAQEQSPERWFLQEYQAVFLNDEGSVFRRIQEAICPEIQQDMGLSGHQYVIGVDLARLYDFSAFAVMDVSTTPNRLVHLVRYQHVDYVRQAQDIRALYERFQPIAIVVEQNSMGLPMIDFLRQGREVTYPDLVLLRKRGGGSLVHALHRSGYRQTFSDDRSLPWDPHEVRYGRILQVVDPFEITAMSGLWQSGQFLEGLPIVPFITTNTSKGLIIQSLALAFERNEIQIIDHPVLIDELQQYEMTQLPGGSYRYSAPIGRHDDTVMGLALAWWGSRPVYDDPGLFLGSDQISISPV
jgi:hypothetical protein